MSLDGKERNFRVSTLDGQVLDDGVSTLMARGQS